MGSSEVKSDGREVLTVAQVAKRLGISVASVRRRFDAGVFAGYFTAPGEGHEDVRGFKLRGHRRIFVDSVEAYEAALRRSEVEVAHGPTPQNS